jgi:hypothetical protein
VFRTASGTPIKAAVIAKAGLSMLYVLIWYGFPRAAALINASLKEMEYGISIKLNLRSKVSHSVGKGFLEFTVQASHDFVYLNSRHFF